MDVYEIKRNGRKIYKKSVDYKPFIYLLLGILAGILVILAEFKVLGCI